GLNGSFQLTRIGLGKSAGIGVSLKQRRRDHIHADIGALCGEDRRHQELQRIPVVQGAVGVGILLGENTCDVLRALLAERVGFWFPTDCHSWAWARYSGSCHSRRVLSVLPEIASRPSALRATHVTPDAWPVRQAISQPESTSHSRSV